MIKIEVGKLYTLPVIQLSVYRGRLWDVPDANLNQHKVIDQAGINETTPFMVLSWKRQHTAAQSCWWWVEILTGDKMGYIEVEEGDHVKPFKVEL